jgi:hypothetical protein
MSPWDYEAGWQANPPAKSPVVTKGTEVTECVEEASKK